MPEVGAGEVLIKVAYAGVNRPDVLQRSGRYPPPADASPHIGLEVAGVIAAVGQGVDEWQQGRPRLRTDQRRRLCGIRHRAGGQVPAGAEGLRMRAGGGAAGELLHRLGQPHRGGRSQGRRNGADPRRHVRHRHHRHPDGQGLGRARFLHRGHDEKAAAARDGWAPMRPSTTGPRTSWRRSRS